MKMKNAASNYWPHFVIGTCHDFDDNNMILGITIGQILHTPLISTLGLVMSLTAITPNVM